MASSFEHTVGSKTLTISTGKLAQKANGSVVMGLGDSNLLVTATMGAPREGIDFFPMTIDFEERLYARGKIPGSFFRREGRPSTEAILVDRLTDRPLRPLFPKGFRNEVQIIGTSLSTDLEEPLDILMIAGASAALTISDIPFDGPIGATRIGYVDGDFIVNPTYSQLAESRLDIVVAGTVAGVLMMEAGAHELAESIVMEAIRRAQDVNLGLIEWQSEIARAVGKEKSGFESSEPPAELASRARSVVGSRLSDAYDLPRDSSERSTRIDGVKADVVEQLGSTYEEADVSRAFKAIEEDEVRTRILKKGERPDGRGLKEIRPVSAEVGILPRTHGTGLFNRGETQILGIATLGPVGDAQRLDNLGPAASKGFMLHYNFPPFSTGETGRVGSPRRRDIGHGALAERAVQPVLPSIEEFPYTIRIVAEALSSNGSTSMASVCASSLALMDAGVPIKTPVAGISVGLVTGDGGEYVTLTDIQGVEDHTGDMDFKVAGSAEGITAIQLDIKVKSIDYEMIEQALAQAKEARLYLLGVMAETIREARAEVSEYAPKITRIQIPVEKIGLVIGPAGKVIRKIIEETGATVDVQDDGSVYVGSPDSDAVKRAIETIQGLTREIKAGDIFTGKVVRVLDFGAFVELLPGKDGMVHISELANYRVPSVEDVVSVGDEITVVVRAVDDTGRVSLSRRALLEGGEGAEDGLEEGDRGDGPSAESRPPVGDGGRSGYGGQGGGRDRGGPRSGGPGRGGPRPGFRPPGGRRPPPRR